MKNSYIYNSLRFIRNFLLNSFFTSLQDRNYARIYVLSNLCSGDNRPSWSLPHILLSSAPVFYNYSSTFLQSTLNEFCLNPFKLSIKKSFMAVTRHATGHSAPRKTTTTSVTTTTNSPASRKKKTTTTTRPKANTSKPRAQATTSGRVTKSRAPATKNPPRKTSVKDKVEGVLEKIVGAVEGRPGKKVRLLLFFYLNSI